MEQQFKGIALRGSVLGSADVPEPILTRFPVCKETIVGGEAPAFPWRVLIPWDGEPPVHLSPHGLVVSHYPDSYPPARSIFNTTGSYIRVGMRE